MLGSRSSEAQYTANYQTNTISGVTSIWTGDYVVGSNTFADVLVITNGGSLVVPGARGFLGYEASSSNNSVMVSGGTWTTTDHLYIGNSGSGNSMVISNGGTVVNSIGYIGYYTGSTNNSVLVTGSVSHWNNLSSIYLGFNGSGNSLVISNGGTVVNSNGTVGVNSDSSNNRVLVTGSGSVWTNSSYVNVGGYGSGNSMVINTSGTVVNTNGRIGYNAGANNNSVLVTGTGSVWSNSGDVFVGFDGSGNSLVISNGGAVLNSLGYIGNDDDASGNSVLVTGTGSVWSNSSSVFVGFDGSGNSLVISNGGTVVSSNLYVGSNSTSSNNLVTLNGGNLIVTNPAQSGVLDVRRGTLTMNSGTNTVDTLLLTNGVSSVMVFNGGSLTVRTATIGTGAVLQFALGTNSNPAVVSSNLTLAGALNITDAGGFTNGTYTLFTYGGTLTYNGVTIGTAPSGYDYAINTNTASQVNLTVTHQLPVAGFSGGPTSGVAPLPVTFTDTSTGNITNRFWDFGDSNTTNTAAPGMSHTYNAGTYTVSLTVSGLWGSDTSTRTSYIVAIAPSHLVVSPASRNYGAVAVGQSSNQTFSVMNTGQQTLTGSASVGSPFAIISGSSYSVPGGETNTVTVGFSPVAAGSFTGAVIFASDGGNSTNAVTGTALTSVQLRVSPASYNFGTLATGTTAQASFVVTNAGGSTLSGTATVSGPPSGGFTVASGSPFNLAGFASTNVAVRFTPPGTGAFSNSVVFASNGGNSTNAVTGSGAIVPVAQFTGSPTNGMAPLVVTFSNLSTGTITHVAWNFGDGGTSIATNPTHTYTNAATFSVSLTVIGPAGSNTLNRSGYITVGNPLAPVFTTGPTVTNALLQIGNLAVVEAGDTNVFSVMATDPGTNQLSYQWLFGDGVTNVWSLSGLAQHAYTTNYCGPYAASVTVSNGWAAISTNLTVAVACELTVTKMQVKLNFAKTNSDSCSLTATLEDLVAGYDLTNKVVTLDVGGTTNVTFTLDAKGRGVSTFGSCKLAYGKKTGLWTLTAKLRKGSWQTPWANYSMISSNIPRPGISITNFPVISVLDTNAFVGIRNLHYTAKYGKSGTAK